MSYFTNYPRVKYKFGNESTTTEVQDIGAYIDILDSVKDDVSFYQEYNLRDGDRPDQVSYTLYETPEYYWTFFMLNDDLKRRGWPVTNSRIINKAKEEYPNTTLTTRANLAEQFLVGSTVEGQTSGAMGVVLRRRPDMGQVIVQKTPTNQTFTGTPDTSSNLDIEITTAHTFSNTSDWVVTNTTTDTTVTDFSVVLSSDKTEATIRDLAFGYEYEITAKILADADFLTGENILTTENEVLKSIKVDTAVEEYNAKHHYEDVNGRYVDISPNAPFVQRVSYEISWDTLGTDATNFTIDAINISNLSSIFTDFSLDEVTTQAVLGNTIPGGSALTIGGALQAQFNNDDDYTVDDWQTNFLGGILGFTEEFLNVVTLQLGAIVNSIAASGGTPPTSIVYHTFTLVDNQLNLYGTESQTPQYLVFEFRSDVSVDMTTVLGGAYEPLPFDSILANDSGDNNERNFVVYKNIGFTGSSVNQSPFLDTKTTGEDGVLENNSALVFVQNEFETYISDNYDDIIPASLTPVTFLERYQLENEEVRPIKVLKPEVVQQLDRQFKKILSETSAEEVQTFIGNVLGISSFTATETNTAVPATTTSSGGSTTTSSGGSGY